MKRRISQARAAWRILRTEGPSSLIRRIALRASKHVVEQARALPVRREDLLSVDPEGSQPDWKLEPLDVSERATVISWVMSPPSPNSGGHQNLFRFIDVAERAGHRCHLYFYTSTDVVVNPTAMRAMLKESGNYPDVAASMEMYDARKGVAGDSHALIATSWETAYPAFQDSSRARRLYFVQDFEPAFYPWGTEYILAEATYRFGFSGITAGGWLAHKLASDYAMQAGHFDFSVDHDRYRLTNDQPRSGVFFYARPATPRRGFELGVAALAELARRRPGIDIHLAGEDIGPRDLGFEFRNHAALALDDLNKLYNSCATALVLSATNMSLLPLELLAAGVVPVVNDAPNNRMVSDNSFIRYAPPRPTALANAMIDVLEDPNPVQLARSASASVAGHSWHDSGEQFLAAYVEALRG